MFLQWKEGEESSSTNEGLSGGMLHDIAEVQRIVQEQLVAVEHLKKDAAALIAIYGDGLAKLAKLHAREEP